MNMPEGVSLAPLYTAVPCAYSTQLLSEYVAAELKVQHPPEEIELYILRWLCDNGMAIVKRN